MVIIYKYIKKKIALSFTTFMLMRVQVRNSLVFAHRAHIKRINVLWLALRKYTFNDKTKVIVSSLFMLITSYYACLYSINVIDIFQKYSNISIMDELPCPLFYLNVAVQQLGNISVPIIHPIIIHIGINSARNVIWVKIWA